MTDQSSLSTSEAELKPTTPKSSAKKPTKKPFLSTKALISLASFILFVTIAGLVIFLAQGYRFQNNQIYGTGILVVTSTPTGATVRLNDIVSGATNTTISTLKPGTYNLSVSKEGYTDWSRQVVIEKEKVTTIKALMAPVNPSLSPISSTPASRTFLSPDGQKLAYTVPSGTSAGLWMIDLSSQPFNLARKPSQLLQDSDDLTYSTAPTIEWAANSKDLLVTFNPEDNTTSYLISLNNPLQPQSVGSNLAQLKVDWQKEAQANFKEISANFPKDIQEIIAANQATIQWSPDNLKFIYQTEADGKYIYHTYDKEKKKHYTTFEHSKESLSVIRWYADSEHLMILEKDNLNSTSGTISTIAMEGQNKQQLYKGTLISDTLYTYLNGSKLVILTSFNLQDSTYYLYSINLQ